jgi:hypothetical protein
VSGALQTGAPTRAADVAQEQARFWYWTRTEYARKARSSLAMAVGTLLHQEIERLYQTNDLETATGEQLDALVGLTGTPRR